MPIDTTWKKAPVMTVLLGLVGLVGCAGNTRTDTSANTNNPLTVSAPMPGTLAPDPAPDASYAGDTLRDDMTSYRLTDAQIASVAMTANRLDSTSAAGVVDRLSNNDALSFARRMTIAHGGMMDSLRAITTRLGSASGAHELSSALEQKASEAEEASGNRLDRSYMQKSIAMHQRILRALDDALLPQVRDSSLRELLLQMRTAKETHLQDAESVLVRLPYR